MGCLEETARRLWFIAYTPTKKKLKERMIYLADEREVYAKYVAGEKGIFTKLFSPDSSIRTTVIIVGLIMIGIGWYKK